MPRLPFPDDVPHDGALFRLLDELHRLHARAGRPGARQLEKRGSYSHTTVHQMFTRGRVPKFPVLMGVVSSLLSLAPGVDQDDVLHRFGSLWTEADAEEALQVAAARRTPASENLRPSPETGNQAAPEVSKPPPARPDDPVSANGFEVTVGLGPARYFTSHHENEGVNWDAAPLKSRLQRLVEEAGMSLAEAEVPIWISLNGSEPNNFDPPPFLCQALTVRSSYPTIDLVEAIITLSTIRDDEADEVYAMWREFRPEPLLGIWCDAGGISVRTERYLEIATSRAPWSAALLRGVDARQRHYVVKIFSSLDADEIAREELQRDAFHARKMAQLSGGLGSVTESDNWLAPASFGNVNIAGAPDVPYLVMPYYPSRSVREYLTRISGPLTLDWCLRLSEQMFRACAKLADARIVGRDAKLSNFVFNQGAYASELTSEDEIAIGPVCQPDPYDRRHDPVLSMIDLSMVYVQGRYDQQPLGTEFWASPRAISGISDSQSFNLTSLDDAFTIAVNSIYLFTEQPPAYFPRSRVALEQLAGGDVHVEAPLIDLSKFFAELADGRVLGPTEEDMLVGGREWLMARGLREEHACSAAADMVRDIRSMLVETSALHRPFRKLPFVRR